MSDPGREERREQRRRGLLEAAVRAIEQTGADCSMDRIAVEAGITKPILYRHFGDKGGLARALAADYSQILTEALEAVDKERPSLAPRNLLVAKLDAGLGVFARHATLLRFLSREQAFTAESKPGLPAGMAALGLADRVFEPILRAMLTERGRDPEVAESWAYAMAGMISGTCTWWLYTDQRTPRAALVDSLVVLVWDGLASVLGED